MKQNILATIRSAFLRFLPDRLLFLFKKYHYVRALKTFSETDCQVVRLLVDPGQSVIDIGANVGWYTKILSDLVGEEGRVISIEPVPVTFELLSFCVGKLRLKNVRLINCAVSDQNGVLLMEVPQYETGGDDFYQARIVDNAWMDGRLRRYKVAARSIDSLLSDLLCEIAFIKCDVEGHELSVVKGAHQLIEHSRPALLIEVSRDPDSPETESYSLFCFLESLGYTPYWFDGRRLRKRVKGDRSVNYFFLQTRHMRLLEARAMQLES